MSSRPIAPTKPTFLSPPFSYDVGYFGTLSANLNILVAQIENPGLVKTSGLNITNLLNNDTTLAVGDVFEVDGFLKVSRINNPHVAGNVGTGSVGSVTVTIS
tara:strand:+ start:92 stop:397 length:306 start_codon:yes stop_codon:yes gene_type:complete